MGDYVRLKENKGIVLKNTLGKKRKKKRKKLKTVFCMLENLMLFSLKSMNTSFQVFSVCFFICCYLHGRSDLGNKCRPTGRTSF